MRYWVVAGQDGATKRFQAHMSYNPGKGGCEYQSIKNYWDEPSRPSITQGLGRCHRIREPHHHALPTETFRQVPGLCKRERQSSGCHRWVDGTEGTDTLTLWPTLPPPNLWILKGWSTQFIIALPVRSHQFTWVAERKRRGRGRGQKVKIYSYKINKLLGCNAQHSAYG